LRPSNVEGQPAFAIESLPLALERLGQTIRRERVGRRNFVDAGHVWRSA
jgi:hypothetical protein